MLFHTNLFAFGIHSTQVALSSSSLGPLLLQQQEPLPTWSLLALFLAELKHWGSCTQQAQQAGDGIKLNGGLVACAVPPGMAGWLPYLEALPECPGTVLEWPRKQVRRLQTSAFLCCPWQTGCPTWKCTTANNSTPWLLTSGTVLRFCNNTPPSPRALLLSVSWSSVQPSNRRHVHQKHECVYCAGPVPAQRLPLASKSPHHNPGCGGIL